MRWPRRAVNQSPKPTPGHHALLLPRRRPAAIEMGNLTTMGRAQKHRFDKCRGRPCRRHRARCHHPRRASDVSASA
jgi:hypothetical protein